MNQINNIRGKTAVVGLAEAGCGVTPGWTGDGNRRRPAPLFSDYFEHRGRS